MKTVLFANIVLRKLGAYEELLVEVGAEFARHRDEFVLVLAGEPIPALAERLRAASVRWHVVEGWTAADGREHPWRIVRPALKLLREEKPDVAAVHFGNELPTLAVSWLARLGVRPGVRWVWEQDQQICDAGRLTRHVSKIRLLQLGVDRFVAAYGGGGVSMARRGIPSSRISVIRNSLGPYTPLRAKGWFRKEVAAREGEVIFVATSSLIPRKRLHLVIEACARLRALGLESWRLVLIGDGPERLKLEALSRTRGIAEQVVFLGLRNDVREILPECDVFVHASQAETCTYAITESMVAGIPAVVLAAGAAREQIEDGVSGYVLDSPDPADFAARLHELGVAPDLRRQMGAVARQRWDQKLRLDRAVRDYYTVYSTVAARGGASHS
jgi:glycosyltransferase involved in cell wall biosynthesis